MKEEDLVVAHQFHRSVRLLLTNRSVFPLQTQAVSCGKGPNVQKGILIRCIKYSGLLTLLLVLAGLPSFGARAQDFKTLHHFGSFPEDGAAPLSGVSLVGNTLFGMTSGGGNDGTVFSLNTDGSAYNVLFGFRWNIEGVPVGAFAISGHILYGTGERGGSTWPPDKGSIFSVDLQGTNQILNSWYDFEPFFGDGVQPDGVILSDPLLYGVTHFGGQFGHGTVYVFDGSIVSNLYSFAGADGVTPRGSLLLDNGRLYGVTISGGSSGYGTVYAIDTNGTGFRTLHHFTGSTNGEGANPQAALTLSGNLLLGTTSGGGAWGNGTVFGVSIDGTGFRTLHDFTDGEGARPTAALTLSGSTLYGTTAYGGASNLGTVFTLNLDGGGFTTLHSFSGTDGASPVSGLILAGDALYGTTYNYGNHGWGTVFRMSATRPPPRLFIIPSGSNVVLSWPSDSSFFLQSTASLGLPRAWARVVPGPVVLNGLNTVTNPISGGPQFFRLSQ